MPTQRELLKIAAAKMGLIMKTWEPGDGRTRFRFMYANKVNDHCTYDSVTSDQIAETCLGYKEAYWFLNGVYAGHKIIKGENYWENKDLNNPNWIGGLAFKP